MAIQQFVIFKLENETFALNINKVKEIVQIAEITRVPNVPDYIEGMMNMRGHVYAVVGLRNKFHYSSEKLNNNARIMLINSGNTIVGVVVDEIVEIRNVEDKDLEKTPEIISKVKAEFIKGVIKNTENVTIILDIDKVFDVAA